LGGKERHKHARRARRALAGRRRGAPRADAGEPVTSPCLDPALPGQVGAVCGGVRRAVVQLPVEAGVRYYVIVDGMTGYAHDFNVSFSARPLDTPLDWQARPSRPQPEPYPAEMKNYRTPCAEECRHVVVCRALPCVPAPVAAETGWIGAVLASGWLRARRASPARVAWWCRATWRRTGARCSSARTAAPPSAARHAQAYAQRIQVLQEQVHHEQVLPPVPVRGSRRTCWANEQAASSMTRQAQPAEHGLLSMGD